MPIRIPSFARITLLAATACLTSLVLAPEAADAARACKQPSVSGGNRPVEPGRINQSLLNAAIAAQVNYLRCRKGLPQLSSQPRLRKVAEGHARWMARARNLTHNSNVPGKRTASARVISTGIDLRMGSENIAKVSLYQLDGIRQFRISNASACQFATQKGAPIARHSYNTLAKYVAGLWYESAKHRQNMMDPRAKMVGTAAGFDPKAQYCGQLYITQNLAG